MKKLLTTTAMIGALTFCSQHFLISDNILLQELY